MSRVQAQEMPVKIVEESTEAAPEEHVKRVVVECNSTGNDLRHGQLVKIDPHVFETEAKGNLQMAVVTGIELRAVSSNAPEGVTVGMKLFENKGGASNSEGWLFSKQHVDMNAKHAHENDGYVNLVNVLPFEKGRFANQSLYSPSMVNKEHISQYGNLNMQKLWENVVQFPNESYCYVGQGHVLLDVVRNNWEQLGVDVDSEELREGNYVKLGKDLVENVVQQLHDNVIMKLPVTDLTKAAVRFQSNTSGSSQYKVVCEFAVKYQYPSVDE